MSPRSLGDRMRELEWFHGLRALPDAWPILRVDGRGFSRLTEQCFDKPFDRRFFEHMLGAARALMTELSGVYALAQSDEISVLLPIATTLFDRELEKLVSVSAGIASAIFTHGSGQPAHFDSRLWLGATVDHVVDYFRWRQSDAVRCSLNGWCYWTLRNEGRSAPQATRALEGKTRDDKHELLFSRGVNFNDIPAWQKRGAGLYFESYDKTADNPLTGEEVVATRRRLAVDEEMPAGEAYSRFVRDLIERA